MSISLDAQGDLPEAFLPANSNSFNDNVERVRLFVLDLPSSVVVEKIIPPFCEDAFCRYDHADQQGRKDIENGLASLGKTMQQKELLLAWKFGNHLATHRAALSWQKDLHPVRKKGNEICYAVGKQLRA